MCMSMCMHKCLWMCIILFSCMYSYVLVCMYRELYVHFLLM